ncbi:MAG: restriction endonuclease subunit S [Candidatus Thiodiazotropha endolucinida]|nr:restriction endonuclease subunit S [Candidatus Thiodiazotropha endolucinida]
MTTMNHSEKWQNLKLDSVGVLFCGQSPSTKDVNSDGNGTTYITGPEQWDGNKIHQNKWTTNPKRIVPDGCIFITVKGSGVGKIFPGIAGAIGRDIYAFKPSEEHSAKYIEYALKFTVQDILKNAVGDIPGISKGHILGHEVLVPTLEQQKCIVAKIEELFSHIDAGIEALKKAKQLLKQYRQSVLKAAVNGELTKEWREKNSISQESWKDSTIGEIASVKTGKTPKRSSAEFWENGTIPWLTSSVTNEVFTHQAEQFVTQAAVDEGLKLFEPGTLLLAMYGEGKTRGQVTEITFQATCNQACAAIIVDENKASRAFVRLHLHENYEETRKAASGGNQPNLNLSKVRDITLPLPILAEQDEIVVRVEQEFEAIERLEKDIEAQLLKTEKNKQSILVSAFSGDLTHE